MNFIVIKPYENVKKNSDKYEKDSKTFINFDFVIEVGKVKTDYDNEGDRNLIYSIEIWLDNPKNSIKRIEYYDESDRDEFYNYLIEMVCWKQDLLIVEERTAGNNSDPMFDLIMKNRGSSGV